MRDFINFHDLENKASQSPHDFLQAIELLFEKGGADLAVEALRISGICVDIYGTEKYKQLLDDAINLINAHTNGQSDSVKLLIQDLVLFNALFQDFRDFRDHAGVKSILPQEQIPSFLLSAELFLGSLSEYAKGKNIDEIYKKYPFLVGFGDEKSGLVKPEKVFAQLFQFIDRNAEQFGTVLKYLVFEGAPLTGISSPISPEIIRTSRDHIALYSYYDVLYKKYEYWRFWGGSLISKSKSQIYFQPKSQESYSSFRISQFRARVRRSTWLQEFRLIMDQVIVNPNTQLLPKAGLRSPTEFLSASFCYDYFGSDDLSEYVQGVSLAEWIRAYTILIQISSDFLLQRNSIKPFTLSDWCIIEKEEEWANIFMANGIEKNKAKTIIKNLTFNEKAKDLLDCPFIPIDGSLVILPSLVEAIATADVMLSNFVHRDLGVGFKGKGFEKRIIAMLNSQGIIGVNIKTRQNDENFECDVIFTLDDNLFFLECKTFFQPNSPRTYYDYVHKISEAVDQLRRIASFYEKHLDIVKKQLTLTDNWQPKKVFKLVVSSALLGETFIIDDCYVTDESIIGRFFDRESPGHRIGHVAIRMPDLNYEGAVTAEKLMRVVSDPLPIKLIAREMKKKYTKIEMHKLTFTFDELVGDEMYHLRNRQIKKLAKALGVSASDLTKKIRGD